MWDFLSLVIQRHWKANVAFFSEEWEHLEQRRRRDATVVNRMGERRSRSLLVFWAFHDYQRGKDQCKEQYKGTARDTFRNSLQWSGIVPWNALAQLHVSVVKVWLKPEGGCTAMSAPTQSSREPVEVGLSPYLPWPVVAAVTLSEQNITQNLFSNCCFTWNNNTTSLFCLN